jgi:hypothetical protein
MIKLTKQDTIDVFNKLKHSICKKIERGHYISALRDFNIAGWWAYDFNFTYYDDDMEQFVRELSEKFITPVHIDSIDNKYALIVKTCLDNRGLQQQYFRALTVNQAEVLFIIVDSIDNCPETVKEIRSYSKASFLVLGDLENDILKAKKIVKTLVDYKPSKILIHSMPGDAATFMACHAIIGVEKFNINLTDHAYWPGSSFIDYNIEFRSYGMTVSEERRGFKQDQELMMPYYPITSKYTSFMGFNNIPKDKIKIFTGGSFYKMFGENFAFFRLMDKILGGTVNTIILIAGNGDIYEMNEILSSMVNKDRVYLIGDRRDINAVFDNIDIYLGTYPMPGGLMTQFACLHGKPVLALGSRKMPNSKIEGLCNHFSNAVKTFYDIDELVNYAKKLVMNKSLRTEVGNKEKEAMITPEKFSKEFWHLINTKENHWHWQKEIIDYNYFAQMYLDMENNYGHSHLKDLMRSLKFRFFMLFPKYWIDFISFAISRALEK